MGRLEEKREGKLNSRERRFCGLYAWLGNPWEAARRAGYREKNAGESALKLLAREEIRAEAERWRRIYQEDARQAALAGLCRLALGERNDAVRLATDRGELSAAELEQLDLFGVSEIRPGKDRGFEVRFCDRLAATEALLRLAEETAGGEDLHPLYRALEKGAAAWRENPPATDDAL